MSSGKKWPFCLSLNALTHYGLVGDAIWQHRSELTLDQVMVYCLTAPSWHQAITWTNADFSLVRSFGIYLRTLSQEILLISEVFWCLPEDRFTWNFSHWWGLVAFTCGQFHRKCSRYLSFLPLIWLMSLKIIDLAHYGLVTPYDSIDLGQYWLR